MSVTETELTEPPAVTGTGAQSSVNPRQGRKDRRILGLRRRDGSASALGEAPSMKLANVVSGVQWCLATQRQHPSRYAQGPVVEHGSSSAVGSGPHDRNGAAGGRPVRNRN